LFLAELPADKRENSAAVGGVGMGVGEKDHGESFP